MYKPTKEFESFIQATVLGSKVTEVLLEGPPGCGKTAAAKYIMDKLGLGEDEYLRFVCTRETSFQDFTFERTVTKGSIVHIDSRFLQLLSRPSLIVIDEFGLAMPDVLAGLNSVLDHEKRLILPDGRIIERHPQCVIIFTSNPPHYAGVKRQHGGFLDRLPTHAMGYSTDEKEILEDLFPKVKEDEEKQKTMAQLLKLAEVMRSAQVHKGLETIISTRSLINIMRMVDNGGDPLEAINACVKVDPSERETVNDFVMTIFNAPLIKDEKTGEFELDLVTTITKERDKYKKELDAVKKNKEESQAKMAELLKQLKENN